MLKLQYLFSLSLHLFCRFLRIEGVIIEIRRKLAEKYLRANGLEDLLARDLSHGEPLLRLKDRTKVVDLARLHRLISSGRFRHIREYGAGASTIVIANAIVKSGSSDQILVTIEESQEWLDKVLAQLEPNARNLVTGLVRKYISSGDQGTAAECDLVLSAAVPGVPDLVYVDGPTLYASQPIRGVALVDGWREPVNVDVLSVAHTMRKGAVILFDDRPASYWAVLKGLRRPVIAWSSSIYSINQITLL